MITVILESPYAGDIEKNTEYARECMLDCLDRGEAPMVSHLLYTQVLDDYNADDRQKGIDAGLAWRFVAKKSVVYTDLGISKGMEYGIDAAKASGIQLSIEHWQDSPQSLKKNMTSLLKNVWMRLDPL